MDQDDRHKIKAKAILAALLRAYAQNDKLPFQDLVEDKVAESWMHDAVSLTAIAAVEAAQELSKRNPDPINREMWSNLIVNRILRGVLWTIHNRNAPGLHPFTRESPSYIGRDRRLECSLSSELLFDNEIVYIS